MKTISIGCVVLAVGLAVCLCAPILKGQTFTSQWQASSGLYPDELAYPYELHNTSPQDPVLAAGVLTLSTAGNAEAMRYHMPTLGWPDPLVIEGQTKYVTGTASVLHRTHLGLGFINGGSMTNVLFVGNGEIFLLADKNIRGAQAAVPTADDLHNYRIEVTSAGQIDVFYDGVLKLEDDLFYWEDEPEIIYFGDSSGVASGDSQWQFLQHNAVLPAPGDTDIDCDVDFADFNTLANNYTGPGGTGKSWAEGNFDGDSDVDFSDFNELANHYTGPGSGCKGVPEPSTVALFCMAAVDLLVCGFRRRKQAA